MKQTPQEHRRTTALKIPCPWSGDENDPIPWTYRWWFRLYKHTRRIRHWFHLHDWQSSTWRRCTWCGAHETKIR